MPPSTTLAATDVPADAVNRRARSAVPAYLVGSALFLIVALVMYRPWESHPFDILDFSEFLPLLTSNESYVARVSALVRHYFVEQGRFNALVYAGLSLKWTVLGDNPAAWYLARFTIMLGIIGATFALLRRLGASAAAAMLASGLFLVANTASVAFTRLTMAEPLGLAFVLVAAHLAVGYQTSTRWRRDAVVIAIALALAMLTKEMLAACAPFVLLLATTRRDERFDVPRVDARSIRLVLVTVLACVAASVPIVLAAVGASTQSFTASYGTTSLSPAWYLELVARMLLLQPLLFPGNLLLAVVLLTGFLCAVSRRAGRETWTKVALAMSLPAVAALLYLPWPKFEHFYGLPFLLGAAFLLVIALEEIERRWQRGTLLAYTAVLVALVYHALNATQSARESAAKRVVNAKVANILAGDTRGDTIVVASPYQVKQAWQGTGPTLSRYAAATHAGVTQRPAIDVPCVEGGRRYRFGLGNAVLVTYSDGCGSLPRSTHTAREFYTYIDWATMSLRRDSLRADVLLPATR
ncbi:MAG TPA: hypothetical protein VJ672_07775 [Gemmatimonadaceae bacterium]|nr:hypothetical protein [Gemmatimonadaceae bacterium]